MNTPYREIRYSVESGGIKRKLISLGISDKDGSLFIALRGLVTPVFFLNLIIGKKIDDYKNYGFEYNNKNMVLLPINQ